VQKYLVGEGYAASAIYSDFSELKDDNREKSGTIRIVYKDVSQNIEQKLTKELKQKFSSEMIRLGESLNENASSDLQIQFF
jgi:argininosuccinate lyase